MPETESARRKSTRLLVAVLLALHVLPVWIVGNFPTQDGSSHVYNARVLAEYDDAESYRLRDVYQLNLWPFPNWATHGLIAFPLSFLPPRAAEKVVVSLCLGLLPLSLLYLLSQVDRRRTLVGLAGFFLSYNYLLQLGFYNFALSVGMFFLTLGFWWRRRREPSSARFLVLIGLTLTTYLCHAQSFLLLVAMLTFLAVWDVLEARLRREPFAPTIRRGLVFGAAMLPVYFLAVNVYVESALGAHTRHLRPTELLDYFLAFGSVVFFRDDHALFGQALYVVVAALLAGTLVLRARRARREGFAAALDGSEPFLIAAIGMVVLFFVSPWSVGSGRWVNDRLHLFVVPLLLPFLRLDAVGPRLQRAVVAALVVISLAHAGLATHDNHYLSAEIDEMVASVGEIEPHSTVDLEYPGRNGVEQRTSDHLGEIRHVSPFLYVMTYAFLESRDVAFLANYEATLEYFPVNYRAGWPDAGEAGGLVPADYVLAWRLLEERLDEVHAELVGNYEIASEGRHSRLYRRRRILDAELWNGRTGLRLDLQPEDGTPAPRSLVVTPDTTYTDGRYGWVSLAPRTGSIDGSDPLRGDAIEGHGMPGILRVDLPDGTWRLVLHATFRGDGVEPPRVLANDEAVTRRMGGVLAHELEVTDGRLTLVVGASSSSAHWRLAAVSLHRVY